MRRYRTVEVKETTDVTEVNEFLKLEEWSLRDVATIDGKITYVLIRSELVERSIDFL